MDNDRIHMASKANNTTMELEENILSSQENSTSELMLESIIVALDFSVVTISNCSVFVGVTLNKANFLVPWLVVYLLGIVSAYITSICYLFINWFSECFWKTLALGMVYNILWILVKTTYDDIKCISSRSVMNKKDDIFPEISVPTKTPDVCEMEESFVELKVTA